MARAQAEPLELLLVPVEEENIVFRQFLPIKHYLEDKLGRQVQLEIAHNPEAALDRIGQGRVDLAYLDPSLYCEGKSVYQLYPLVKVVKDQEGQYSSVLVVRESSSVEKIVQIPGKRLALGNTRSSSAYIMPLAMLQEANIDLEDFAQVGFLQKEDQVALSVLVRDYDVGAMSRDVAQKYLPYGLRIIKESKKLPQFIICAAPQMSPELRQFLQCALLDYSPGEFDTISFTRAKDQEYNILRVILKNITGKDYLSYPKGVVKLALLPIYSPISLDRMFSPLAEYLSRKTGREFRLVIPRDFKEFATMIRQGQADFSYQDPYVYLLLAEGEGLTALATSLGPRDEKPKDQFRGVILVRKDSGIDSLQGLRGREIMIVDKESSGGYWFQKVFLDQKGIDISSQAKLKEGKTHEEVILSVYRGLAEAGFVREQALKVAKDLVETEDLEVLARTDYYPHWCLAACKGTDRGLVEEVRSSLLDFDEPELLERAGIVGFAPDQGQRLEGFKGQVQLK
jgi:phosphate/phosphite/phosphonate ABC transporter binding protein